MGLLQMLSGGRKSSACLSLLQGQRQTARLGHSRPASGNGHRHSGHRVPLLQFHWQRGQLHAVSGHCEIRKNAERSVPTHQSRAGARLRQRTAQACRRHHLRRLIFCYSFVYFQQIMHNNLINHLLYKTQQQQQQTKKETPHVLRSFTKKKKRKINNVATSGDFSLLFFLFLCCFLYFCTLTTYCYYAYYNYNYYFTIYFVTNDKHTTQKVYEFSFSFGQYLGLLANFILILFFL